MIIINVTQINVVRLMKTFGTYYMPIYFRCRWKEISNNNSIMVNEALIASTDCTR